MKVTARAYSNIAFIKYWGNQDDALRLPSNSSISMNLASLYTDTTVSWEENLTTDQLILNDKPANEKALERVSLHLDKLRERLQINTRAHVRSSNNFPMGAGIASSASAFAALTLAATTAAGASLSESELTTFARLGSGSASRSIPAGFVVWHAGNSHETSFAESIASTEHWNLVDVVAIVSDQHKHTTSQAGHPTARTSDLQDARVAGAAQRMEMCVQAVQNCDFATFANVVEQDSNLMHAVMMTSQPPLFYWKPTTLTVMENVRQWRSEGKQVCYTLDAGPNIHCLCLEEDANWVREQLLNTSGVVDVRLSKTGGAAHIINNVG